MYWHSLSYLFSHMLISLLRHPHVWSLRRYLGHPRIRTSRGPRWYSTPVLLSRLCTHSHTIYAGEMVRSLCPLFPRLDITHIHTSPLPPPPPSPFTACEEFSRDNIHHNLSNFSNPTDPTNPNSACEEFSRDNITMWPTDLHSMTVVLMVDRGSCSVVTKVPLY
jgi:hypothetical protein